MHLSRLPQTAYICASCFRAIASRTPRNVYFSARRSFSARSAISATLRPATGVPLQRNAYSTVTTRTKPLRIAIIGSGPAGFYTAYRLMTKLPDAFVDMYEQLPVPYGLVRFGVAPDHPEVKNCQDKFAEVASSPRFTYHGNLAVGTSLPLSALAPHYNSVLFSYGASYDRTLGITGENLKNVYSAREFVGWYNGLPQFQHLNPDLESGEEAVIIGQGNVALDVARVLLSDVDRLRHTDMTDQALDTLSRSRIRDVRVVGRRGPLQAAFTIKEVRELMKLPDVHFRPIQPPHLIDKNGPNRDQALTSFFPDDLSTLPRAQKRIVELLQKGSPTPATGAKKTWSLDFLLAPTAFRPSLHFEKDKLDHILFARQAFSPDADPYSKTASVVPRVVPGEGQVPGIMKASVAFRSVGYKSAAIPGLSDLGVPFDDKLGIIPNDPYGRIVSPHTGPGGLAAGHIPGLYCAGWVKRGPTGVIASTMEDAFTSADVIAADWTAGVPFLNFEGAEDKSTGLGWEGVKDEVQKQGLRPVSWKEWQALDLLEQERGAKVGKPREKFASVEEMLNALDSAAVV